MRGVFVYNFYIDFTKYTILYLSAVLGWVYKECCLKCDCNIM